MSLHKRVQLHNLDRRTYTEGQLLWVAFGGPLLGGLLVLGLWLGGVRPAEPTCQPKAGTVGWLQH